MQTTLIRLKPYDVRRGHLLKRYTYAGIRFAAGEWCCVDTAVADYLSTVHQTDRYSPLAFELGDEEPEPAPASAPPPSAIALAATVEVEDVEALVAELTLLVFEPPTSPAIELTAGVNAADVEALVTEQTLLAVESPGVAVEPSMAASVLIEPSTAAAEPVTPVADPPAVSVESVAPIVEPVLVADETSTKSPVEAVEGMLPAAVADASALVVCATEPAPTASTAADDAGDLETPGAAPAPSRGHASQRRNGLQERVRDAQRRRDGTRPDPADRRPSRGRPAPMQPPPSRRQRGPPGLLVRNRQLYLVGRLVTDVLVCGQSDLAERERCARSPWFTTRTLSPIALELA